CSTRRTSRRIRRCGLWRFVVLRRVAHASSVRDPYPRRWSGMMRYHLHKIWQALALFGAITPLPLHAQAHAGAHWTYKGNEGPSHWGALDSAYALCARGKAQSPINIVPTAPLQLPGLSIAYLPTAINILNNGHT